MPTAKATAPNSETEQTDTTNASSVLKSLQGLYERVSVDSYRPKVKDRKVLQGVYNDFAKVAEDEDTFLDDLSALQDLLQKCQRIIH